ncbi:hypothetical protein Tco_0599416 [Tanacetum coccineum]
MESIISCETAKVTWTDLVHIFGGPFDTKENKIMDLKLEYQTFRAKTSKTLSQTYTRYKTLLNELANDGVTLSKNEINVSFMNSLLKKWLSFSQGLRNANHTQTLDLADIYERFVYKDNLISRRYSETKKALISTPSDSPISTAFFSNNIVQDLQENFNDEADERTSEEYLSDLDIKFHKRALLANSKCFIKRKNNFSIQKANEDTKCYKCGKKVILQEIDFLKRLNHLINLLCLIHPQFQEGEPKVQKDYKAEYKKMKAKLALLEACPPTSQSSKPFQLKNKGLVTETFNWDKEEVSDDEEEIKVERLNPDSKLSNFNIRKILVPESQAINECLQLTEESFNPKSSKETGSEPQTPLPPLKNL